MNIHSNTSIIQTVLNTINNDLKDESQFLEMALIERTCSTVYSNDITIIGEYAFRYCTSLASINFPECIYIRNAAFMDCYSLTSGNFPKCTSIDNQAFYNCSNLTSISFPVCTSIGSNAFCNCSNLSQIYLMSPVMCSLDNSNAFQGTGIRSAAGSIFVPSSLVTSYKAATNWAFFSNRIYSFSI